jgi:hypothetical protein
MAAGDASHAAQAFVHPGAHHARALAEKQTGRDFFFATVLQEGCILAA